MLTGTLPARIEASAVKRLMYRTEVVDTDGGTEHRDGRWVNPRAEWDVTVPPAKRTSAEYTETTSLFAAAKGSLDTFMFHDPVSCADIEVRFKDDTLVMQGVGNMVTLSFTLIEVR